MNLKKGYELQLPIDGKKLLDCYLFVNQSGLLYHQIVTS
jgi:hypothetical protein